MTCTENKSETICWLQRLIGLLFILASLLAGWLWMDYRTVVDAPLRLDHAEIIEIGKGEPLVSLTRRLGERGILIHPWWFQLLAWINGDHRHIKYGEYEIPPGISPRALLAKLTSGKVMQHPVTLVEGRTFAEYLAELENQPVLDHKLAGLSAEDIMRRLDAPGLAAEGRFFPDTYYVIRGTSDLEVLRRARRRMSEVLEREWPARAGDLPYSTPDAALTAASIVEKETARPDERPKVAGVIARRLNRNMRLQMDPTVIYGLGEGFGGDLRKSDLLRDTPYNTYTRTGLPPTPIAMPGLGAIRAVLHPDEADSLYFVARGDGSHVFSATLEEHNRAVAQFQKASP